MGVSPRPLHPPIAPRAEGESLSPGTYLLKVVDDITGEVYYLHAPVPLGSSSVFHYLIGVGSLARKLYKAFEPLGPEVESILEDLPWE